jgi:enoyl-CoA hydratase
MRTPFVRASLRDGVARIVLTRAERQNALTVAGWNDLSEALADFAGAADVRCLVLQGAPSFSAGNDLDELARMPVAAARRAMRAVEETLQRVEQFPVPTIAAVQGWSLGSGFQLALACDLRLAGSDARFGLPVARLGLMLSPQMLAPLINMLGSSLLRELLFTARTLTAEEACARQVVSRVVPTAELEGALADVVREVCVGSVGALRAAKAALALCQPVTLNYGTPPEFPYLIDEADFHEGVRAVLERRLPRFGTGA